MTTTALTNTLGGVGVLGRRIDSTLEWVDALERGLPTDALEAAIEHGILTREEADSYVIPRRTLSHRKQRRQPLTQEESDRLGRIVRLTARAEETFGNQAGAVTWLRQPNGALGGQTPLEFLRGGEGAVLVERILIRIDHGVYT